MTAASTSVRVIAAYATPAGRTRAVVELDDGRIGLADGRPDRGEEGRLLFDPQPLIEARRFAELVLAGNATALAHPRGSLVLAATLVAVLESLVETGDRHDEGK